MIDTGAAQTVIAKKISPKKPKRGRKRIADESEKYLVRLERFEPSYSFHLNSGMYLKRDGAYSEYFDLMIHGTLISPEIKRVAAVKVWVTADMPPDHKDFPESPNYSPRSACAGSARLINGTLQIFLPVPFQVLSMLMPALIAGQMELLTADGYKLKYRYTTLTGMRFEAKYRPKLDR